MLNAYKELTPVIYGEHSIKDIFLKQDAGKLCFKMHWHDRLELLYVTEGCLKLHLDEHQVTVHAGQVAVIGPQMLHCGFAGENGAAFHAIMFPLEEFLNKTAASDKYLVPVTKNVIHFDTAISNNNITEAVKQLLHILNESNANHSLSAVGLIYIIMGHLYQYGVARTDTFHKTDSKFYQVADFINEHYTEDISAKSLSHLFGYNETYFCRRFKATTGINLMRYIRILRMELAQKLLCNTDEGITQIAVKCGFTDISYFSHCFKQHTGAAPTEFKTSYRSAR